VTKDGTDICGQDLEKLPTLLSSGLQEDYSEDSLALQVIK
jgi:hypothetical protein